MMLSVVLSISLQLAQDDNKSIRAKTQTTNDMMKRAKGEGIVDTANLSSR